jgi:hypothetical protein
MRLRRGGDLGPKEHTDNRLQKTGKFTMDNFRIRVYPLVMSQINKNHAPDLSHRELFRDGLLQAH